MKIKTLKLPKPKITPWILWISFLSLAIIIGVGAGLFVFWKGLSVTNLTDLVPWGLWITIDLSSIAIAAGAFSLCAGVYLIGLKRYHAVARTATFIGLIGYTMALFTLLMDIGRPDRFWHALVYWNSHSLLWEVTMCVTLYLVVFIFETMPLFANLEWLQKKFPKINRENERCPPLCTLPGCSGFGIIHAAPIITGSSLRGVESATFVVPPGYLGAVHHFCSGSRHGHDCVRFHDLCTTFQAYQGG